MKVKVIYHQNIAKANANQWLDTLKPQLISTNQNIINYNTKFQNYYDTILTAVDQKNKNTLTKGIQRLSADISENKEKVDQLVKDLNGFQNTMIKDTQNFKETANQLTSILVSKNTGLRLLQSHRP